ncbi:facilitated trehalose transporter Tret1-like [Anthonomus grandis grandis]|uniref:facilitated trehalose transporter Tret1-like n=1 Tax=Anthonomus grandis grandis TaxID=2921223 RepID=UPI002165045C|nr:facilitated trehalose transporter Tret1-like [Anthonomus grandis grandis]
MKINRLKQLVPQVIATFLATFMAASDGMTFAWTSPMIPYFKSNETHIVMTDNDIEWMETIGLLGAAFGLPFTILGVNRLGRKPSLIISAIFGCVCWIGMLTAESVAVLLAAKFISGMAGDMCFVAAPMYVAEIANPDIRGFLSALIFVMMLVGILTMYTVGSLAPYSAAPLVGIALTTCQAVLFLFMPESPYYLVYVNKKEEARKCLVRLRGAEADIDSEIYEIEKAVERQKTEKGRPQDLILIESNRRAFFIMLILNGLQHFVGFSAILMNLHVILDEAGSVYINSSTAAIIFAAIMLLSGIVASVIIDKFGRKKLLIASSVSTGVILTVVAVYFNLKHLQHDVRHVSWIPAVGIMIYAATFKLGLGLVPIVVTAEIFPTTVKGIGMTLADLIYVVSSLLSIVSYTSLFQNYGMHAPFYLFTVCAFFSSAIIYYYVPETKGKTLDEIQLMLKGLKPGDI